MMAIAPTPAKRRGRRPGTPNRAPSAPRAGSLNAQLAGIALGGYLYLEVEPDGVQPLQARVQLASRYPDSMRGWRFTVAAYTAVRASALGDVRVLVRVERVE